MIRVLIVEDSPTVAAFLVGILESAADFQVVATVTDGVQAVAAVERLRPDVVTMDIHMPKLNGFDATRQIMESHPVPIVIVSGTMGDQMAATFRAVEAGALAFVPRPVGIGHPDYAASSNGLIQAVRLMAEVKVVRRWKKTATPTSPSLPASVLSTTPYPKTGDSRMVVIGASTGGPIALRTLIAGLPRDFPLPLLAVQHIATGFVQGFVDWLALSSQLPIHLAAHGEIPLPGHIYIAPDAAHLGLGPRGLIVLDKGPPENGLRPAVSHLFRTVTQTFGANVIGILLSGMGADGAEELKRMRDLGAVTIVQNKESSVVHGMPGVALALGAAVHVLPPEEISALLKALTHKGETHPQR